MYDSLTNIDIQFIEFLLTKIIRDDSENGNMFYKLKNLEYEVLSEDDREELIKYIKTADIIKKLNISDERIEDCINKLRNPLKYRFYNILFEIIDNMDILKDNLDEKELNELIKNMSKHLTLCLNMIKEKFNNNANNDTQNPLLYIEQALSEDLRL